MARIRSVKPEFWTHDDVLKCSRDARLLFVGMWNFCDANGVHPAKATTLRCEVFPGDDDVTALMVEAWVGELIAAGLIEVFEADEKRYWHLPGFTRNQVIANEKPRHPAPPNKDLRQKVVEQSCTASASVNDRSSTVQDQVQVQVQERTLLPPDPSDDPSPDARTARNPDPAKVATKPKNAIPKDGPGSFREFYAAYPKKVDPGDAEKAFAQAMKALVPQRFATFAEAGAFLSQRATAFARSPAGQQGKFTKGPAPWLRARGYDSDDSSWQLSEGKYGGNQKHAARSGAGFVHAGDDSIL